MSAKREVALHYTHVRSGARGCDAVCLCDTGREGAMRNARVRRGVRGRDVVRESAMRDARVRRGTREHTYVR
mgnify:CR=1 FL=1